MFITKLFATVKNWTQSTVSGGWGAGIHSGRVVSPALRTVGETATWREAGIHEMTRKRDAITTPTEKGVFQRKHFYVG